MTDQRKTKEELITELEEIRLDNLRLKTLLEKNLSGISQKEDDLNESHKLLHDVQKLAKIGLWEWDKATDIVSWSDELFKIAGLDSNLPAPSYAEHHKIYTQPSWDVLQAAVENTLNTGEAYQLELELIRPDGTIRNVRAVGGAKFSAEQNKITGLYGLVQDETERKRTEKALQESEEKFKEMANLLPQIVFESDLKGNLTYVNKNAFEIFGYPEDYPILSKSSLDFYTPESKQKALKNISKKVAGNQKNVGNEYEMIRKDGSIFPALVYSTPIIKESKPFGLRGIIVDITELKQAEQALIDSEMLFRGFFNYSPVGINVFDMEGKVIAINGVARNYFGVSKNDPLSAYRLFDDISISDETKWKIKHGQVAKEERYIDFKAIKEMGMYSSIKDENDIICISLTYAAYGPDKANPLGIVVFIQDITERKQTENELRLSEDRNLLLSSVTMEGILIHRNGIAKELNHTLVKMLGYDYEELLNKNFIEFFHPDDHALVLENISKEYAFPYEARAINKNGEITPIEIESKNFHYQDEQWRVSAIRDITQRKQGEELQQTMAEMLDIAPNSITVHDTTGRFLYANQKTFELHGYTEAEFMAINQHDLDVPESEALFEERFRMIAETGYASFEVAHYHKNGHAFPLEVFTKTVNWKGQAAILSIATDITERKLTEAELEESREKYRGLSEASFEAIFISEKGVCIEQNQAAELMFGYTSEEAMNHYGTDWIVPEDREMVINNMISGYEEPYEAMALRKNGTTFPCLLQGKMTHYKGRNVRVTSLTDITEQKKAEREIIKAKEKAEASKKQLTTLIEAIPDAIFLKDGEGRWLITNEPARNLYKLNDTEWKNKTDSQLGELHPEHQAALLGCINGDNLAWETGKMIIINETITNEQNDNRYLEVRKVPLFTNEGKREGLVIAAEDITEKKNVEIELIKAKEKAEESDRLKSAFLANMSHEIRTPMNGILGFAELLKQPNLSGDEQNKCIRIIEKSGARMLNIINEIVDISKIEAGLMEIDITEININELINFTYQFFKPEVELKGIVLSLQNDLQAQEVIIKTDKEKLQAILFNLIKNAVKYTKTGSIEFGVSTSSTTRSDYETVELAFFVKDTGIGIPADRQQAIFERFIQADILDKKAYQGAGLGLSISKAYVEMLGGRIWVESKVGIGSTFCFTIPLNSKEKEKYLSGELENSIRIENEIKPERPKLKVLIVEDDETSALLISEVIKTISKEILNATTGIQAVNHCQNNPDIDLILMDIRMPEMDGYEATHRIRQFNKEIIIIAQTAHGLSGDREKSIVAGANDYISKPIKKEELLKLIRFYY